MGVVDEARLRERMSIEAQALTSDVPITHIPFVPPAGLIRSRADLRAVVKSRVELASRDHAHARVESYSQARHG